MSLSSLDVTEVVILTIYGAISDEKSHRRKSLNSVISKRISIFLFSIIKLAVTRNAANLKFSYHFRKHPLDTSMNWEWEVLQGYPELAQIGELFRVTSAYEHWH